ncbi:MAG: polysaccharide deacetylase family protein [Candidatus Omnitrophota bacterium]
MKNKRFFVVAAILIVFSLYAYHFGVNRDYFRLRRDIAAQFRDNRPQLWSEVIPGIKRRLDSSDKVLALTLDACGSRSDGYDATLIDFLIKENIPATLFITGRWINKNPGVFKQLARQPLFEIENHGLNHKPCSVSGKSVYGIRGTRSANEVVDEVERNARKIERLTGRKPHFYRSGTAYYDEIGLRIVQALGYQAVGFSVLGDKGATYSKEEIKKALAHVRSGDIIICHMNHPERETAEGLMAVLPQLRQMGFRFVKLSEYQLK